MQGDAGEARGAEAALEERLRALAAMRAEEHAADQHAIAVEQARLREVAGSRLRSRVRHGAKRVGRKLAARRHDLDRGYPLAALPLAGSGTVRWRDTVAVLGIERPALPADPPASFAWDVDLPRGAVLKGWMALQPNAWPLAERGVVLTAELTAPGGASLGKKSFAIDPRRREEHRRWVPWRWELPVAGACRLVLRTSVPEGRSEEYVWALIGDPRVGGSWLPTAPPALALPALPSITRRSEPLITFLVPVHDPAPELLDATLRSLHEQTDPVWAAVVVDDGSSDPVVHERLRRFAEDPRVTLLRHEQAQGISGATNAAFATAQTDYVATLDHDDVLTPDAVEAVCAALGADPAIDVLYSDNDLTAAGINFAASLKPDWSPDLMRAVMYTLHLGVYRRSLVHQAGGWRSELDGAQDHDLVLRLAERTSAIHHLPRVLYHWRAHAGSAALGDLAKPTAYDRGRQAVAAHLERTGIGGSVERLPQAGRYRVRHAPAPLAATLTLSEHADRREALIGLAGAYEPDDLLLVLEAPMHFEQDAIDELTGLVAGGGAGAAGGVVVDSGERLAAGAIAFPDGLPVPVHPDGRLGPDPHATLSIVTNRLAVRGAVVVRAGAVARHVPALPQVSELLLVALTAAISDAGGRIAFSPHARFVVGDVVWEELRRWPLAEAAALDRGAKADPYWNPQRWIDRGDETIPEAVHANPIKLPAV